MAKLLFFTLAKKKIPYEGLYFIPNPYGDTLNEIAGVSEDPHVVYTRANILKEVKWLYNNFLIVSWKRSRCVSCKMHYTCIYLTPKRKPDDAFASEYRTPVCSVNCARFMDFAGILAGKS